MFSEHIRTVTMFPVDQRSRLSAELQCIYAGTTSPPFRERVTACVRVCMCMCICACMYLTLLIYFLARNYTRPPRSNVRIPIDPMCNIFSIISQITEPRYVESWRVSPLLPSARFKTD